MSTNLRSWSISATALVLLCAAPTAQDLGHPGPSLAGCGPTLGSPSPTESRPESKLWFHDRRWWGSLWSASAQAFHIHRLDPAAHSWIDTGVAVEARPDSHSDALCAGPKLWIATHEFAQGAGSSGHPMLLLRYSYAAGSYALDAGFPVTIGDSSTQSMVLERDSTGRLWAVWMQGRRVRESHSLGSDLVWSAPAVLPGCTSDTTSDEVTGVIAFGGDRIGVLWSDESQLAFPFAVHRDADAPGTWQPVELALAGEADDHLNLKSDAAGRVYAVVRNQHDELKLLVRDGDAWSQHLVSDAAASLSRPILLVDELAGRLHVFATRGGVVREKVSALEAIAFPPGNGTAVIRDDDASVVNPTASKQNVRADTGLVVLAASPAATGTYWHHEVARVSRPKALALAPGNPAYSSPLSVTLPLVASGAGPGAELVFFARLRAGARPLRLGSARADAAGRATLELRLPRGLAEPLAFEVVEPRARRTASSG